MTDSPAGEAPMSGPSESSINESSMEQALRDDACSFEFFQAVALLQRLQFNDRQAVGQFSNPEDEAVQFRVNNTLAFPAYKNLSFSLGTLDSYLNDTPSSEPPTKHNSFQFTMGITYAIKSKY